MKTYYSSHGKTYTFGEFIHIEVEERGNYKLEDVLKWRDEHKISEEDKCIWVCEEKWRAHSYNFPVEERDKVVPDDDKMTVYEFTEERGFIIPESHDGDGGWLFVFWNEAEKRDRYLRTLAEEGGRK